MLLNGGGSNVVERTDGSSGGGSPPGPPGVIPKLSFSEITLGRMVGEGGFCRVTEVSSVDLEDIYDTSDEDARLRREFAGDVNRRGGGGNGSRGLSFVLKTLRGDLPDEELEKGIIDLAIEAEFLAVLAHPNIIAMRAMANSDPHSGRFFVVLDRLTQTLDKKFNYWRKLVGDNAGYWFPLVGYCCARTPTLHALWKERMAAVLSIARAIRHLHSLGIVYRDLKPDNIGFDFAGGLKIFDFGLAKRVDEAERTLDGRYLLTGNTGSLRYMAPEVALNEPYTYTVDSYSFGIIFWQICSLTTPFAGYSEKMHATKVVQNGERPNPDPTWPHSWVEIMRACWSPDPAGRPSFDAIVESAEHRYYELEQDDDVLPTRANEIRAKKRKTKVPEHDRLGVDTRIAGADLGLNTADASDSKSVDADIV